MRQIGTGGVHARKGLVVFVEGDTERVFYSRLIRHLIQTNPDREPVSVRLIRMSTAWWLRFKGKQRSLKTRSSGAIPVFIWRGMLLRRRCLRAQPEAAVNWPGAQGVES